MSFQKKSRKHFSKHEIKATAWTSLPSNVETFNIENSAEHARLRRVGVKRVSQEFLNLTSKQLFLSLLPQKY